MHLVASVRLSVCPSALSRLILLTYDLDIWYIGRPWLGYGGVRTWVEGSQAPENRAMAEAPTYTTRALVSPPPCPRATVSWSPMVGGTRQYSSALTPKRSQ